MNKVKVESEAIATIGWENDELIIEFNNGHSYKYSKVGREIFDKLIECNSNGSSIGRFYNASIKGKYKETKL